MNDWTFFQDPCKQGKSHHHIDSWSQPALALGHCRKAVPDTDSGLLPTLAFTSPHLSLNCEGCLGTTDDFTTSFLFFFSSFCSLLPSGTWRTPGLSSPWCCLPTSSSVSVSALSSSPLHCALQDAFGQTWWTEDMSLLWSGGLRVVQLPAGSWHGNRRW